MATATLIDHLYDDGLEHNHHWARESRPGDDLSERRCGPTVPHAASVPTPSSALHDDAHYA